MAATITTAVVAAGDVSDFTPTVQDALRAGVAAEVGVATEAVTLTVEAASVRLTFETSLPASVDAANATAALSTQLADPAAASTFLNAAIVDAGVTSFTISVESIEIAPTSEAEQGPASQLSAGAIAGIIVGGIVGVVVLALIVFKMTRKGRSGSDKPNFKKSANANAQVSV